MTLFRYCKNFTDIIPSLTKISDNLVKFKFYCGIQHFPLSFIANFTNLQEIILSLDYTEPFEDFKKLQHVTFSQLQILRITFTYAFPEFKLLIKFLEVSGKTLKELYVGEGGDCDNSFNLAVAKFCPNLRKLSVGFKNNELETMKIVFNSCQYLESIKIWCGGELLSEKEALEMLVNYSPKYLCELIFYHLYYVRSVLLPEELESFLVIWKNREPQKSLSLIIVRYDELSLDSNDENLDIIEKYIDLGIIKNFKVTDFEDEMYG